MSIFTNEDLDPYLSVNFDTGDITWKTRSISDFNGCLRACNSWNSRYAGKSALNSVSSNGYYCGTLFGRHILAHRLIWYMAKGYWPEYIDHINGNRIDNRLVNLREVSFGENMRNVKLLKTNTTGSVGIRQLSSGNWQARITYNRKAITIGTFESKQEAIEARNKAQSHYNFHENHGRVI